MQMERIRLTPQHAEYLAELIENSFDEADYHQLVCLQTKGGCDCSNARESIKEAAASVRQERVLYRTG
jgi:hypothetical protein